MVSLGVLLDFWLLLYGCQSIMLFISLDYLLLLMMN